jgi:hypothetical protein
VRVPIHLRIPILSVCELSPENMLQVLRCGLTLIRFRLFVAPRHAGGRVPLCTAQWMSDQAFVIEGSVLPAVSAVYALLFVLSIHLARRRKVGLAAGGDNASAGAGAAVAVPFSYWGRWIGLVVTVASLVLGIDVHGTLRLQRTPTTASDRACPFFALQVLAAFFQ